MTRQRNIRGDRYDDGEPCYLSAANGMLFNRVTRRWVTYDSLQALAEGSTHTWANREIGIPSILWQLSNSRGQHWFPSLDDTAGLASETVTNGEDWTDAALTTPPTGWVVEGIAPSFSVTDGVMTFGAIGAGVHTLTQSLTVVAGTTYVIEVKLDDGTDGSFITLDGYSLPVTGPAVRAFSYTPSGTSMDLTLMINSTNTMVLDYLRVYEESELTGSGSTATIVEPPIGSIAEGPFVASGMQYWIFTLNWKTGFNLDDDAESDVWLTPEQVCELDIPDRAKRRISKKHVDLGGDPLPCMTED